MMQHERALSEFFVRTLPLGEDRRGNIYWRFAGDEYRLFVQVRSLSGNNAAPVPPKEGPDVDLVLNRLFDSRPNRFEYQWKILGTSSELWKIWDSLSDRIECEKELKSQIKANFDFVEPEVVYQTTGSDWIGRKVERKFGKKVT